MAEHLKPLLLSLPRDTPIITTHCFVGMAAAALGFTKVINLVIDNHAQWFIVVPGAYNLVQGPSNYHNLLRMGVPADRLVLAGGWIGKVPSLYLPCTFPVPSLYLPCTFPPTASSSPAAGSGRTCSTTSRPTARRGAPARARASRGGSSSRLAAPGRRRPL
jgi:hypothetical protein